MVFHLPGHEPAGFCVVKAGKLRGLAVTTATRLDVLPDIPAIGDFVPGYEASSWFGIGAPKNTPANIVGKLNQEINAALADPSRSGHEGKSALGD